MPKPAQSKGEKAKARSSWQEVLSSWEAEYGGDAR